MSIKANRGEWSELYAFLKILCDGKIPAADKNLKEITDKYFIFHKIIREDVLWMRKIYHIENLSRIQIETESSEWNSLTIFTDSNLPTKTRRIFEKIRDWEWRTFSIPDAELLMKDLECKKVKADPTLKADLVGIIEDRISSTLQELWFSIKSMVWSASTLFNAGDTTNFIFKVTWFKGNISDINTIKSRSKIRDRVKHIERAWWKFEFKKVKNPTFAGNLRKIDSVFLKIIASMLYDFFTGKWTTIQELTSGLNDNKKLWEEYGFTPKDYELKIKNFLDAIALGMIPSEEWEWISLAKWWYIVVRDDGSIVCYHLYNRDEFRDYLFENTKFETASSTRHGFWTLYEEDWELLFNLNLQIRF